MYLHSGAALAVDETSGCLLSMTFHDWAAAELCKLDAFVGNLSYNRNSLEGVLYGITWENTIRLIKGIDTRSLDYSSIDFTTLWMAAESGKVDVCSPYKARKVSFCLSLNTKPINPEV